MSKASDVARAGVRIVGQIQRNTLAGLDKDGVLFAPYSTRPFSMPWSAIASKNKMRALYKQGKQSGKPQPPNANVRFYRHKKTKGMWAVFMGGYQSYKTAMRGRQAHPNLHFTGAMLKGLGLLNSRAEWSAEGKKLGVTVPKAIRWTVGWKDSKLAQRAYYNKLRGRDMFGLSEAQVLEIVNDFIHRT